MLREGLPYFLLWGSGYLLMALAALVLFCATLINPRTGAKQRCEPVAHPVPLSAPVTLRVITFNIADAHLFTTNRRERMLAIGALLTRLDPDVAGLQESFVREDRELLLKALADSRLRHHALYPAGVFGNGLLTLSAYPIVDTCFYRFRHNNRWYKLHQGDWWAGKGVGLARIRLLDGSLIDFYNTHLQAQRRDPHNAMQRVKQTGELVAFVRATRAPSTPALLVGDFNGKLREPDIQSLMNDEGCLLLMRQPKGIDFIFGIPATGGAMEVRDAVEITETTRGGRPAIFLSRAPTPCEYWRMHFGAPEVTPLSDHRGYLTSVRITPVTSA